FTSCSTSTLATASLSLSPKPNTFRTLPSVPFSAAALSASWSPSLKELSAKAVRKSARSWNPTAFSFRNGTKFAPTGSRCVPRRKKSSNLAREMVQLYDQLNRLARHGPRDRFLFFPQPQDAPHHAGPRRGRLANLRRADQLQT